MLLHCRLCFLPKITSLVVRVAYASLIGGLGLVWKMVPIFQSDNLALHCDARTGSVVQHLMLDYSVWIVGYRSDSRNFEDGAVMSRA